MNLTSRHRRSWTSPIAVAALLSLGSFATTVRTVAAKELHLALPAELQSRADDLPVTQRKRLFLPTRAADRAVVFGDYQVMRYRAGWTERTEQSGGSKVGLYEEKTWRKYSFELEGAGGAKVSAQCAQRKEERGVSVRDSKGQSDFGMPSKRELHCSLSSADGATWELRLSFDHGRLTGPAEATYSVTASNQLEGTSFRPPAPIGFVFAQQERAVAAVEVWGKGRFILSQDLPPATRHAIAAASSALLLASSLE